MTIGQVFNQWRSRGRCNTQTVRIFAAKFRTVRIFEMGSNFRGSNFRGSNFRGNNMNGSNFRGSNFRGSHIRREY